MRAGDVMEIEKSALAGWARGGARHMMDSERRAELHFDSDWRRIAKEETERFCEPGM